MTTDSTPDNASPSPTATPPQRRGLIRAGVLLAALLLILLALRILSPHNQRSSSAGDQTGALDNRVVALNRPAPDFLLPDQAGKSVHLSQMRGKIVLINFWATWCGPCRAELPDIDQVYQEQQGQGLAVFEVNVQEPPSDVVAFKRLIGSMPPILLDQTGAVRDQYGLKGLPDSFFIDRQGIVRAWSYGPMTRETILKNIGSARRATP
ncbi:MAG: TlpA family protein disulfide reductase [Dehalococcoidia bacterium]